jgi:hypothetical protein
MTRYWAGAPIGSEGLFAGPISRVDGVKAWRAEFKGVFDRIGDQVLIERLHSRKTWMNSRLPRLLILASRRRRNLRNCSGNAQSCKGRAWSSAPGSLDQRQIVQGIADKAAALIGSLMAEVQSFLALVCLVAGACSHLYRTSIQT